MDRKIFNGGKFYLLLIFITMAIFSRNVLQTLGLGVLNNFALILIIFTSLYFFFNAKYLKSGYVYIYIYIIYCLLLVLISPVLSHNSSYVGAIIGLTNLVLFLPVWIKFYSKISSVLIVEILCVVGIINACGAIIQFFVSPDLFGLISNSTYAVQDQIEKVNVTKRAISFISSPQSLSLVLAVTFLLITQVLKKKSIGWIISAIVVLIAGLLTVSKAFFIFLFVYSIFQYFRISKFLHVFSFFGVFILLVIGFPYFFERILYIQKYIIDIESYSAYIIWKESIFFPESIANMIIGNGLGLFSRGSQSLLGYQVLSGSTESYLIQIYLETGLIGLLLFLLAFIHALYKSMVMKKEIFSILLSFFVVGIFTPAIYGFSVGFFFTAVLVLASNKESILELM